MLNAGDCGLLKSIGKAQGIAQEICFFLEIKIIDQDIFYFEIMIIVGVNLLQLLLWTQIIGVTAFLLAAIGGTWM